MIKHLAMSKHQTLITLVINAIKSTFLYSYFDIVTNSQ